MEPGCGTVAPPLARLAYMAIAGPPSLAPLLATAAALLTNVVFAIVALAPAPSRITPSLSLAKFEKLKYDSAHQSFQHQVSTQHAVVVD